MQVLLIRHTESQYNVGLTENLDSALSDNGMQQACLTAAWLENNFDLSGYLGIVSPYLRTLQTASVIQAVTGCPFSVDDEVREYIHEQKKSDGITLDNRSLLFANINWPKDWLTDIKYFPKEDLSQFLERISGFLYKMTQLEYDKVIVVSHGAPVRVMTDMIVGEEADYEAGYDKTFMIPSIPNGSLTWIMDGKIHFRSKVVYK